MQGGKSRLDRLFDLLESEAWALGCVSSVSLCFQGGSSAATRHAAAEQIGLVYAAYPDTVATLLAKLLPLLRHCGSDRNGAETRVAAAAAFVEMCSRAPPLAHDPLVPVPRFDYTVATLMSEPDLVADGAPEPEAKKPRVDTSGVSVRMRALLRSSTDPDQQQQQQQQNHHPGTEAPTTLAAMAPLLLVDALAPRWQMRHGALLALRSYSHVAWIQAAVADVAIRVLTRDRFADYSGDRATADGPEAAAALLGCALSQMSSEDFAQVARRLLLEMVAQPHWQVRHGGLLGLRDAVTTRLELMLPHVAHMVPPLLEAMNDASEDVVAVAAEVLLPLANHVPVPAALALLRTLWLRLDPEEQLSDDEGDADQQLSASVASMLHLLRALYTIPAVAAAAVDHPLAAHVPQLFPLFASPTRSVRAALLETLCVLLRCALPAMWAAPLASALLRHTFDHWERETHPELLAATDMLWDLLVAQPACVEAALAQLPDWWRRLRAFDWSNDAHATLVFHGCRAVARLLRALPAPVFTEQVRALVGLQFSTCSARDKTVAALCVAHLAGSLGELRALLAQKLLELLCQWAQLKLTDAAPASSAGARAQCAVSCAWALLVGTHPGAGVDHAAVSALLDGLARERGAMQVFVADALSALLAASSGPQLEPTVMTHLSQHLGARDEEDAPVEESVAGGAGAALAFQSLARVLGVALLDRSQAWWQPVVGALEVASSPTQAAVVHALHVVEAVVRASRVVGPAARDASLALLDWLTGPCLTVPRSEPAYRAYARCLTELAHSFPAPVLSRLCFQVLPCVPEGAQIALFTAIHALLVALQLVACPYLAFMLVPVLGAMSQRDVQVRGAAAAAFAQLVGLMALEANVPDPPEWGPELSARRLDERRFIDQLVGGEPPLVDNASLGLRDLELRPYQRAGVSWLVFLARYSLHGILADDMGLGKTVQALCAIAYAQRQRPDCGPALVVCPASVMHHWEREAQTLFSHFVPLVYAGTPKQRKALWATLRDVNLVVTSYETLRTDVARFSKKRFLYCVLDEGHIIRTADSQVTGAVKQLDAQHRLILSGTPLQNDVIELWSLFDFLMPSFLGEEKQFRATYARPIRAARDAKTKATAREQGTLALDALHRQILPFVLRRTKEAVLTDLPPKIVQDYLCDLSPLQALLYEGFDANADEGTDTARPDEHVFQRLMRERKLLNHPSGALALASDAAKSEADKWLRDNKCTLNEAVHSGKLVALENLLLECGLGVRDAAAAQHRVLLFAQGSASLDLVEELVLRARMPSVSYVRLDSVKTPADRNALVLRFNADPTVDVMLATVKAGGLGINLTGADTVIFFEHDWNPQVDAQAMARAHRLGQKRTVNVYRLITRNTLEEKIMSLQRFKIFMAETMINEENASMSTMNTDALLDLRDTARTEPRGQGDGYANDEELRELAKFAQ